MTPTQLKKLARNVVVALREYAALLEAQPAKEASGRQGDYSAWLIEGDMLPAGQSYAGSAGGRMVWRFDVNVAIHFSRKQDAEAMLDTPWFRRSSANCKVAEHLWPVVYPPSSTRMEGAEPIHTPLLDAETARRTSTPVKQQDLSPAARVPGSFVGIEQPSFKETPGGLT